MILIKATQKITLYNSATSSLAVNDDGNNALFSAIYATHLNPGTYFIKIEGGSSNVVCPDYFVALDVFRDNQPFIDECVSTTNGIKFSWSGDVYSEYQIQYSGDIVDTQEWITAANLRGRLGTMSWTDDGTATTPAPDLATNRYYRIVIQ